MIGIAVRVGARLREFVAQIDEVVIDQRQRLIVQGRLDRFDDLVHLLLAAGARPDMQGQQMLGPVLSARTPVANQTLAESNKGIARGMRRIVIDAGTAEESAKLGRIRQRLVDAALKRPTCTCRHRKSRYGEAGAPLLNASSRCPMIRPWPTLSKPPRSPFGPHG